MKRGGWLRALAGVVFLILATYLCWQRSGPSAPQAVDETIRTATCSIPVTKLVQGTQRDASSAIVFHGLTANKTIMRALGEAVASSTGTIYLVDLPGHGNNIEPFSFDRAEACAVELVSTLERRREIQLDRTVLVGHSMGAGIAIRLADLYPTAATISVSTAMRTIPPGKPVEFVDLELPRRMPVNLVLINAGYDLPITTEASLRLLRAAEGQRYSPRDFAERRAVRWITIPLATHTSLVADPRVLRLADQWARAALPSEFHLQRAPNSLFYAGLAGLAALLLLFPYVASAVHRVFGQPTAKGDSQTAPSVRVAIIWMGAALAGVVLQYNWVPLAPLVRLYSGAYLASVLMIAGVILLHFRERFWQPTPSLHWNLRAVLFSAALALATILVFGAWMNVTLTDAWMNGPRWWRFAVLVPVLLPYCLAEEMALGGQKPQRLAALGRFAGFLLLRGLVWMAMAFGLWVLHSGEILVLLLVVYMAAFSIAQRLGSDAVRQRTGSAAAAVFGAILSAWFIAAVFPIA